MADNNNNDNNSINSNDNDNDDRQRGFLGEVLHQITTPLRVIREINNLEEHLGLNRTTLFQDYNDEANQEELQEIHQDVSQQQQQEEVNEEAYQSDNSFIIPTMPTNSYSFGGFTLDFDNEEPDQNTDFSVGVPTTKENSLRVFAKTSMPSTNCLKQV
jgi:hypothetical protein